MIRIVLLLTFLLYNSQFASSQTAALTFGKLSGPEKLWVLTHPFVANKARKLTIEAITASKEMIKDSLLDGDPADGQVDAFRHGYWMALLSSRMCWRKAVRLGKAHEKTDYKRFKKGILNEEGERPDSISGVMDLFNNRVGASIGCNNWNSSTEKLKEIVKRAVLNGEMKIILKDKNKNAVNLKGVPIHLEEYDRSWHIPKLLVRSGSTN